MRDENEINYPFFLRAEHCIGKVADAPDAPPEKSWLCCSSSDIFEERRLGDGGDEGDEGEMGAVSQDENRSQLIEKNSSRSASAHVQSTIRAQTIALSIIEINIVNSRDFRVQICVDNRWYLNVKAFGKYKKMQAKRKTLAKPANTGGPYMYIGVSELWARSYRPSAASIFG